MKESLSIGEIVQSLAGRDKGEYFVVLKMVDDCFAIISDGRTRKVATPKKKKIKHLKKVSFVSEELIEHIKIGKPLGNERLSKALKAQKEKTQED